ncbi:DUF1465 family protein [Erythrobacteraceae bacterium CFH 75059]|uniref:DUF1465 family protein n=1 Tax=Qipengyuania thermophila TaxID=2509361 RepID=UPI001021B540|nr:DUF1465 family protein [Qipengyuania thermophila]TCD04111.1 DUF1465 family protein [Erythrobacteraceae bacterium CFH 75059]
MPASSEHDTPPLTAHIVEGLYTEALVLADEARHVFDNASIHRLAEAPDPPAVALSIEGLRTTTRVMHILAWLLNQRAFLAGEITERQLHLHGALPPDRDADPQQIAHLDDAARALISASQHLHARLARLDRMQRETLNAKAPPAPVHHLQQKLMSAFS